MKTPPLKRIDLELAEVKALLERARASLDQDDYTKLEALVDTVIYLLEAVEDKRTTIHRLRKLLFGPSSEKSRDVIPPAPAEPSCPIPDDTKATRPQRSGHGRHGVDDYAGAERIRVPHAALQSGDPCPECHKGKVYEVARPGVLVRLTGQAPVQARVYELQKLRCNLCGKVFTAEAPEGVGSEKYDAAAAGMIALLKYGSGLPFNRLEGLQGSLGIPLPASTQWDIVRDTAKMIAPVYEELIRQAAQGEVLHNDDTTIKILELMGKRARQTTLAEGGTENSGKRNASGRSGLFTSGIVSTNQGRRAALFFSGRQHAGENLREVLAHRASVSNPPIQMCDALSRNLPKELKTILGHCLAHGRRQFVDVVERFPQLNEVDPLDYLTELQRHAADLAARPEKWMPWNYRDAVRS